MNEEEEKKLQKEEYNYDDEVENHISIFSVCVIISKK
jgi:hypothetical protein